MSQLRQHCFCSYFVSSKYLLPSKKYARAQTYTDEHRNVDKTKNYKETMRKFSKQLTNGNFIDEINQYTAHKCKKQRTYLNLK